MADIVIRGMEMPKNCLYCPFVSYDNDHCVAIDKDIPIYGTKPSWCPLVPLPEGHGRLGDLDELQKQFEESYDDNAWWYTGRIEDAPTIIEAEGGGEDG